MAFEFLSHLDTTSAFLLIIIFILFVLSFKKVLGLLKNALIIVAASAIFPIAGSKLLGLPIEADSQTIFSFITLGLLAYFLYVLASAVYKGLSLFERAAKSRMPQGTGKKGKDEKGEEEKAETREEKRPVTTKPFIIGSRKRKKNWERDYLQAREVEEGKREESKATPGERQRKERKRKRKKAAMERIRMIGGEEDS